MLKHDAPSSGRPDTTAATTPAARLRRIEAIQRDPDLTRAEADAVVGVVLHANGHGLAWPGQRRLRSLYRLSGPVVTGGLRKAVGKHLADAGIGPRGVRRYRVLSVSPDAEPEGENEHASAPVAGTLNQPASAPTVGALNDTPARQFTPSSAPVSESSAPVQPAQRATNRRATNKVNQREPKEREPDGDGDSLSPCAALSQGKDDGNGTATANGHDKRRDSRETENGNDTTADDRERLIALAYPGGPTAKQRAALVTPLVVSERAGVPAPFVAAALVSNKAGLPVDPWLRVDHAVARAKEIVEGLNSGDAEECARAGTEPVARVITLADLVARGLAEQWPDGKPLGRWKSWTWAGVRRKCMEWPKDGRPLHKTAERARERGHG